MPSSRAAASHNQSKKPLASATGPVVLPQSVAELEALLAAERSRTVATLTSAIEQQITERVTQQITEHVTQQLRQGFAERFERELQRGIATGVAERVQQILEQWRLARHQRFGPSSESHQGELFNEAEALVPEAAGTPAADTGARPRQRRSPEAHRRALPPELPRVDVVVDVAPTERQCACGSVMVRIGEEVSEQLDIVPMQIRVIRTIRPRYACPKGDRAPVVAAAPAQVLPQSQFSAGFLAMIATVKYADGLPLARFAKVLARHGVEIPRQSLARAVIATARALQPLVNLARDVLLESPVIHMDETTVQVLKEPGRKASTKSYMWVQRAGPPGRTVVLFHYAPSRAGTVARDLLAGWCGGYLMTDGYRGYDALGAAEENITHLACMAHARRKFVEAKRAAAGGCSPRADEALAFFARLYCIERRVAHAPEALRARVRAKLSVQTLAALHTWADATLPTVAPKSKLGEALAYLLHLWPRLERYAGRGDLPMDNQAAENAIRPFVVGRKNWLFADTPAGARASAILYSLIETAKACGREPYAWLRFALERLPQAQTTDQYEALMPWNTHDQDLAMNLASWE